MNELINELLTLLQLKFPNAQFFDKESDMKRLINPTGLRFGKGLLTLTYKRDSVLKDVILHETVVGWKTLHYTHIGIMFVTPVPSEGSALGQDIIDAINEFAETEHRTKTWQRLYHYYN